MALLISSPTIAHEGNIVRVSCRVTYKGTHHTVWVEVPKEYQEFIAADATACASPFILPAARHHQQVIIDGAVSSKWKAGVERIIQRAVSWKHGFSPITVTAQSLRPDKKEKKNVGVFFSAGVDSFSSYLKYKNKITHFIFVHGYDIAIDNSDLFATVTNHIEEISRTTGVPCIMIRTNVREITDQLLGWEMAHGGALALVALILRNGFKTIIIPGGGVDNEPEPWGSSAYLDPCWSTETLDIVHDIDHRARYEKVRDFIAPSALALKHLRVCWRNKGYNCGICDKCMMTMAELRMAGVLAKAKTFPSPLDLQKLSTMYTTPYSIQQHVEQAIAYLQKTQKDPELQVALEHSLEYSKHPDMKRRIMSTVQQLDWKYNESRLFVFLNKVSRTKRVKK